MSTRWLRRVLSGIMVGVAARRALGVTVVVPTDQPTVQAAVDAAGAGGTVIIDSNDTFDETVTVTQSLTIHAGAGFTPTIRASGGCGGVVPSCALFFQPDSGSAQTLAVSDLRLLPKSAARGMGPAVVRILNLGSGEASAIFTHVTIENPEGFGFLAFNIRRDCAAGLNHVAFHNSSIDIAGDNEATAGEGGFAMGEGGSLAVSNIHLAMSGIAADAFSLGGAPDCGELVFGLDHSEISVSPPTDRYNADLVFIFSGVTATIEHNSFQAMSNLLGSAGGIMARGGASITLDANRFLGSGPNVRDALQIAPLPDGSVTVKATNNVVQGMKRGFVLGQDVGNPAGGVDATLTNNTVDGSLSDAIALNSANGAELTVTAENNLLTRSGQWGISLTSEAGGFPTIGLDYNGFSGNAAGDVEATLAGGAHDVAGDPLYVDPAGGDLRLGIGSPMVDAGHNSSALTATDADGAMRIQNGTVDIGAFEGAFTAPTGTPTPTPSVTDTPTPSPTAPSTSTATPTRPTPTATAPASRTPTSSPCVGDCDGSGAVSIDELVLGVNIALGTQPASACLALENAQRQLDIAQLVKAVGNALNGCGSG